MPDPIPTPTNTKPTVRGFEFIALPAPIEVIAWPDDYAFLPCPMKGVAVEKCNTFGTERLVARYEYPNYPVRKENGLRADWPSHTVYLSARHVSGWVPSYAGKADAPATP